MPTITGFSHISLSVRDRDRSRDFYRDVLGFGVLEENNEDDFLEWILVHPTGAVLCLQQHKTNAGESFTPQRTGLDHVGFKVGDRAALDAWAGRLDALGVVRSPITDRDYGGVLCFRDPDDIQLELFYRENHP
jgi:glyoxylase I family protein